MVGASSLVPTARTLERRGWSCRVPTPVRDPNNPPSWREWSARLLDALSDVDRPILAGHSAAGLLLPSVAAAVNASALLFIDARVPPPRGHAAPVDAEFLTFIDALPTERGRLPPWSRWWGDGRLQKLIVDTELRAQFEADLPRLTKSWFVDAIDVPEWQTRRCGYLRLSNGYEPEALAARRRGWPVVDVDGSHLHTATAPEETAAALLALIETLDARPDGR
jgi:hypothetical protein